jgi:hypothetical protein
MLTNSVFLLSIKISNLLKKEKKEKRYCIYLFISKMSFSFTFFKNESRASTLPRLIVNFLNQHIINLSAQTKIYRTKAGKSRRTRRRLPTRFGVVIALPSRKGTPLSLGI